MDLGAYGATYVPQKQLWIIALLGLDSVVYHVFTWAASFSNNVKTLRIAEDEGDLPIFDNVLNIFSLPIAKITTRPMGKIADFKPAGGCMQSTEKKKKSKFITGLFRLP